MTIGAYRLTSLTGGAGGSTANPNEYIALASWASPYLIMFKKNGSQYDQLTSAFDVLPTAQAYHINWSPDGNVLVVGQQNFPYYNFYYRSGDSFIKFVPAGWTVPSGTTWTGWASAFSPSGDQLAVIRYESTISKQVVDFFRVSGIGSAFTLTFDSSPIVAATANALMTNLEFSPNGLSFALSKFKDAAGGDTKDIIRVFDRTDSSSLSWTENTVPSTSASFAYSCSWDSTSTSIASAHLSTPYIRVFNKSGATITLNSNLPTLPTGNSHHTDWNANGTTLAVTSTSTPGLHLWNRSGGTFTKITGTPSYSPVYAVQWKKDGSAIATTNLTSPQLKVLARSGDTFTEQTVNQTTTLSNASFYIGWYSP
jgi:hypothetical protein